MMINCFSIDDFIANLDGNGVFNDTVHCNVSRAPLTGSGSIRDATSFSVIFQASAIVQYTGVDRGEALVQFGQDCGIDRLAAPATDEGSDTADQLKHVLKTFCEVNGVKLLPGIIDQQ